MQAWLHQSESQSKPESLFLALATPMLPVVSLWTQTLESIGSPRLDYQIWNQYTLAQISMSRYVPCYGMILAYTLHCLYKAVPYFYVLNTAIQVCTRMKRNLKTVHGCTCKYILHTGTYWLVYTGVIYKNKCQEWQGQQQCVWGQPVTVVK